MSFNIDNFLWYSNEVRRNLSSSLYYLDFLLNETDAQDLSKMEALQERLGSYKQELEDIESEVYQRIEESKTEEDMAREANIKVMKEIYLKETGQPLLLTDKDIMDNLREDFNKIKATANTHQANVDWNEYLSSKPHRESWMNKMKAKLEKFKAKNANQGE